MSKNLNIEYFENKISILKEELLKTTDENKKRELNVALTLYNASIRNLKSDDNLDYLLLPEYRIDGYFQSENFKKIENMVLNEIYNMGISSPKEIELLEQITLKEKYDIDWLPYHKRFISDVSTIKD